MQPTDDICQQNAVGVTYLLADWEIFDWLANKLVTYWMINHLLTDWKIYWTQNNCIKLFLKFLIQAKKKKKS